MTGYSMTRRLVIWLTVAISCFWFVAAGLGVIVMRDEFGEIFDSALQQTAERLMPLVVDDLFQRPETDTPLSLQPNNAVAVAPEDELIYQVRDANGRVILHSHDSTKEPFKAPLVPGFWQDEEHRILTTSAVSNTIFLQVADNMAHRREASLEGAGALLLPILILVPGSILLVWLIVRRLVAPVSELRNAIAGKDSGNMADIELTALPQELQPIMASVNLLLARLRAALSAEREFTANSAHELRTPLAGALAQTQLLIGELAPGPGQERARQVETSLVKLTRLTEKLLQLARAEAGIGATDSDVDLVPVMDLVVLDAKRSTPNPERIRYHRPPGSTLMWAASEDAFAIVIRNLIENAMIHGMPDQPVDIHVETGGNIRITNGAHPFSQTEIADIRQRFGRGKTAAPGSGLGLSIAERLLTQMGASLTLHSPATGREDGFEARIHFGQLPPRK
ncbi:sensor histidine kinase [Rhizobium sp. SL42]|uniref:sensor histidine kinase n=1 Tax=Rhizobium sp. SL42 TaxID=2806346 RepID=UPI001F33599F|nr:HAMP domain-containing sensor histidine kinase [Rhizobium sp. SL42]UJW77453.1 HAMP domain-containing histidine kinase [Rhizobium sp. SL42]